MRRNDLEYERFYRRIAPARAESILAALGVARAAPDQPVVLAASGDGGPLPAQFLRRPKNVILISVESLSASFVGAYGAGEGLTPNLDQLAREGLKFERVFATGTRTVRGLEALSLGTPPIPGQAIVRRPGNEHLASLGEMLAAQGTSAYFFYGGYGYFDNMNAYFGANRYQVIDRTDIPQASVAAENIWGVADESLYDQVLRTIEQVQPAGGPAP